MGVNCIASCLFPFPFAPLPSTRVTALIPFISVRVRRHGFTLVELLVVIAIIALLAGLLLPTLARAKESGQSAKCKSNLRQIGLTLQMYTGDHGFYPPHSDVDWAGKTNRMWFHRLLTYSGGQWTNGIFVCPLFTGYARDFEGVFSGATIGNPAQGSYGYNENGTQKAGSINLQVLGLGPFASGGATRTAESMVVSPADMIAIGDTAGIDKLSYRSEIYKAWTRHKRSHNTLFCDGHVEQMKMGMRTLKTESARRRWNIDNEPHPETWED